MRNKASIASVLSAFILLTGAIAQESSGIKITRLELNNPLSSEISPAILTNGLIFCSDRRTSGLTERTSFDNRRLYNMFFAGRKDTLWEKPVELKNERTGLFNNGPLSISSDAKTIYFTSEIETGTLSKSRKFLNHSGIFIASISGTEITAVKPFRYNNPQYNIGQPSVSADGKYLYFASDMPGGLGGSDIWYCEFTDNDWGPPVNAGSSINSAAVDNYPFIHPSGRLYFSSNREGGLGGLDIYYSLREGNSWGRPSKLPAPVNSPSDDFAYTAQNDILKGYFTSNRRRNDDIYEFVATIIRKSSCDSIQENNYCYEFVEENAVKYDSIPFKFEWNFGDGEKGEGPRVEHCYAKPGKYLVRLDVVNLVTKEFIANEKTSNLEVLAIEQPYISGPDRAFEGELLRFSADSTNLPGWDISRYYWNFEDETMAEGMNVDKTYRAPGLYNIQLIVSSRPGADGNFREACVSKNIRILRKQ
jgi:hypothetical protein